MAADQVTMPGFLESIVTMHMTSLEQRNVSTGVGEGLQVLLGEPSHLLATQAMGRFDPGSVPPVRPSRLLKPPLLQALTERSSRKVCVALESDPESARFPFWDHDLQLLLLCRAMCNDCCSEITEMLLASGAHASTEEDRRGNLPLTLLNWKIAALETPSP